MSDKELKFELAKLLPNFIHITPFMSFDWKGDKDWSIQETEWLYVCSLIEKDLTKNEGADFVGFLIRIVMQRKWPYWWDLSSNEAFEISKATWQQRAIALLKVKKDNK